MAINVSFDGNALQTANIFVTDVTHEQMADRRVSSFLLARNDGAKVTDVHYGTKQIAIIGRISGTSIADLETRLDAFRALFLNQDRNLDVDYGGGTRRYVCTLQNLMITRGGQATTYSNFQANFVATEAFGKDTTTTTLIASTALTSGSMANAVTLGGSAPIQSPTVTVTLTTLTGSGSYNNVSLADGTRTLLISRIWANGDVIVVDSYNKTVTVNGVAADYAGAFPNFALGAGTLTYADDFTARTGTIAATYTKRWI